MRVLNISQVDEVKLACVSLYAAVQLQHSSIARH